ncbi:hypothetical protein SCALIN_C11_0012 [Candidatus Scalindua japonica]|uniref:Uncharacterized protein n=1 Tax=Candidatus Scalindua japonica TaxID=1284222 RepID=A0A286TX36_9BACT|nr:hypothetical protein [Candidatus Scalindua japonica]GAX60401.1 hypothetical protein SCALIN_C11_0012 [Candidatus Scalindua japonica]
MKTKYIKYTLIILIFIFSINKTSYGIGKIVNYFLDDPNAWNDTMRVTSSTPTKIVVKDGTDGLVFKLTDLTVGDVVALVFLETKKVAIFNSKNICDASDKLIHGKNKIVSVITKNYGNRKKFYYQFLLQKTINAVTIDIYNNGEAVLESRYDGTKPVGNMSELSGIKLLEIDVR